MGTSKETLSAETTLADWQAIMIYTCISISASLSLLGSSAIVWVASRKLWRKRHHGKSCQVVYQRLMISISSVDIISGLTLICGAWMVPPSAGYPMAHGTEASCFALGMSFVFVGMAPSLVCGYLSIYFLITTKYGWREHEVAQKLELPAYLLAAAIILAFLLWGALMDGDGLVTQVSSGMFCSVIGGQKAATLVWVYTAVCFLYAGVGIWATYGVYRHVFDVTKASRAHSFTSRNVQESQSAQPLSQALSLASSQHTRPQPKQKRKGDARQQRVKRVAVQAVLYTAALLNTLIWPTVNNLFLSYTNIAAEGHKWYWFLLGLGGFILFPLQGFFNFFIYIQSRVKAWRKCYTTLEEERPAISLWQATLWAVFREDDPPSNPSQVPSSSQLNSSKFTTAISRITRRLSFAPPSMTSAPFSANFSYHNNNNGHQDPMQMPSPSSASSSEGEFGHDATDESLPWWQRGKGLDKEGDTNPKEEATKPKIEEDEETGITAVVPVMPMTEEREDQGESNHDAAVQGDNGSLAVDKNGNEHLSQQQPQEKNATTRGNDCSQTVTMTLEEEISAAVTSNENDLVSQQHTQEQNPTTSGNHCSQTVAITLEKEISAESAMSSVDPVMRSVATASSPTKTDFAAHLNAVPDSPKESGD